MKYYHAAAIVFGAFIGLLTTANPLIGILCVSVLMVTAALSHVSNDQELTQREFFMVEVRAFTRSLWFHPNNDDLEKFVAVALIITWCIITIGVSFGAAEVTTEYTIITAIVWMFIGRLWGQEASKEVTDIQ